MNTSGTLPDGDELSVALAGVPLSHPAARYTEKLNDGQARKAERLLLRVLSSGSGVAALVVLSSVGLPLASKAAGIGATGAAVVAALTALALAVSGGLLLFDVVEVRRLRGAIVVSGLLTIAFAYSAVLLSPPPAPGARHPILAVLPAAELVGALLLLLAVLVSPVARIPSGIARFHGAGTVLITGLVALVVFLPIRLQPTGQGGSFSGIEGTASSALTVAVVVAAASLFAAAAAVSHRRKTRVLGDSVPLFTSALLMLAVSELGRLSLIGIGHAMVSPFDVLRLYAAGFGLAATIRHERRARTQIAKRAALAERQRVARDLHDGIAQDLAFLASHGDHPWEMAEELALAARRALAVSRGFIDDLSDFDHAEVPDAMAAVAQEAEARFGVVIEVEVDPSLRLSSASVRDLLRIEREAVSNAVRHGQASRISVALRMRGAVTVLRVVDNGRGLVAGPESGRTEGFGVASMRDRAAMMGGRLTVGGLRGGGTELLVEFPPAAV